MVRKIHFEVLILKENFEKDFGIFTWIFNRLSEFIRDFRNFGDFCSNLSDFREYYFKCINGIINIPDDVLPPVLNEDRGTRSTNPDCLKFITPKCRTATFQKSFMSRCARVWNILPKELTAKNIGIACFKSRLYKYYESALKIYDVENPRTSKSICLSCNMSCNLFCSNSCY